MMRQIWIKTDRIGGTSRAECVQWMDFSPVISAEYNICIEKDSAILASKTPHSEDNNFGVNLEVGMCMCIGKNKRFYVLLKLIRVLPRL